MILISLLIRHLLKYRRHRLNRHHRHRIATNGIASLFIYCWSQSENKKEDILSIKIKILIIGTNLDNQPKKER